MATRKDDDDVHNPFGNAAKPNKKGKGAKPGVFDPGFGANDQDDPFRESDAERDSVWDEPEDVTSTEDM